MKTLLVMVLSACVLAMVGCGKKQDAAKNASSASASTEKSEFGVIECDQYIKKMEACIAKMPSASRNISEPAFKQIREAWKVTAANPETRAALQAACKASLEALSQNPLCN